MAYAVQDPSVRRVTSIAGNDHGEFIRELQRIQRSLKISDVRRRAPAGRRGRLN